MQTKFNFFNCLGACAYYTRGNDSANCYSHISGANPANLIIEPAGVLGVLMKNYALSTRTLVKGIERTPWMARPDGSGGWEQADLPRHENVQMKGQAIAVELKQRLQ